MGREAVELGLAESVCPQCLKKIEAKKVAYGERVYLEKTCPQHGAFRTLIWEGPGYAAWAREIETARPDACATAVAQGCPYDCGLCPDHRQRSCCILLEITERCNLCCPVCFASAGEESPADPPLGTIEGWLRMLLASGGPFNIQLSGGEPTVREDLGDILRLVKKMGFPFVQLNTNGLRLAEEPGYARELRQAGLDCVYLQFDGVEDAPYIVLRGRPLWEIKQRAVQACAAAGLGVVLVPTLARGVNEGQVGAILRFAFERLPWVRGVHFQPMSFFGRHPGAPQDANRLTLPALLRAIEEQTEGKLRAAHFSPSGGQNAYCGFNGSFLLEIDGSIRPLAASGGCCAPTGSSARAAQEYVARRWSAPQGACCCEPAAPPSCCCDEPAPASCCEESICTDALDAFLERVETHTLAVSCMVFQDAWNLELDRLKQCHIHVVSPQGKLIPFCAYNLTSAEGRALYRGAQVERA